MEGVTTEICLTAPSSWRVRRANFGTPRVSEREYLFGTANCQGNNRLNDFYSSEYSISGNRYSLIFL